LCSFLCSPGSRASSRTAWSAVPARPLKEDKENILVDGLALDFPFRATDDGETMRASQALNLGCHAPIHLSRLSYENRSLTVKVSYFSDSIMASNFPP
jgi:hypothetical protein